MNQGGYAAWDDASRLGGRSARDLGLLEQYGPGPFQVVKVIEAKRRTVAIVVNTLIGPVVFSPGWLKDSQERSPDMPDQQPATPRDFVDRSAKIATELRDKNPAERARRLAQIRRHNPTLAVLIESRLRPGHG